MSRCQVTLYIGNSIEFKISGCIDETLSDFSKLFSDQPILLINLDEVTAINSLGIREWIKLMRTLSAAKIRLTRCPKLFIDQVNIVKGMLPENSQIDSFYVPYYSEKHNLEKKIIFQRDVHFSEKFVNYNTTISGNEGYSYDIDVNPARYFKFVKA